jgi:hypothetical protein
MQNFDSAANDLCSHAQEKVASPEKKALNNPQDATEQGLMFIQPLNHHEEKFQERSPLDCIASLTGLERIEDRRVSPKRRPGRVPTRRGSRLAGAGVSRPAAAPYAAHQSRTVDRWAVFRSKDREDSLE